MESILAWIGSNANWIQIFSLATGIVYLVMQIFQHRLMWYFNLLTAGSALLIALSGSAWAQVFMNSYFLVMAVVGIFRWRKLRSEAGIGHIHVVGLTYRAVNPAIAVVLLGGPLLCFILSMTNDPNPIADGLSMTLSIVAAWFLTRSHKEQWILWVAADLLVIVVYAGMGAWWMVGLYYCYIVSSCFGYYRWHTRGVRIDGR
jgi:nicotinamide mononucleotide transporter